MSVINTNIKALVAQDSMVKVNRSLSTAMERLSTGSRINTAADDAAGLSITTRMDSQVRGLSQAIRNANDGISIVQTTEGALEEVTSMLQRIRELAVQSVNASNNADDRAAMNAEVVQLKTEIDRVAATTQFNNMNLLDGSFRNKVLQIGDKAHQTMNLSVASVKAQDLGYGTNSTAANTLIGGRVDFATTTTKNILAGQIVINGVGLSAFTANTNDDLSDIIRDINGKVPGVVASGFNTVVADNAGTGVTTNGQMTIRVRALSDLAGVIPGETEFVLGPSNSMGELVANINSTAGGLVQASVNAQGKLVLSNETGATIKVTDVSVARGSGFSLGTEEVFQGFLKLESTTGQPIEVKRGDLSNTTIETRDVLSFIGLRENVKTSTSDGFTVVGKAMDDGGTSASWIAGDLKINGVDMFDAQIATTTFQGKIDTINKFSSETGVTASGFAEQTFKTEGLVTGAVGELLVVNGVEASIATASAQGLVTAINSITKATNVSARLEGTNIVVTGRDVSGVTLSTNKTTGINTAATGTVFGAAADPVQVTIKAGLRLDSVDNRPISIQLSKDADSNARAVGSRDGSFGLLEQNVGAADYDVNASTLNANGSQVLSRVSVVSAEASSRAIGVVDNAIQQINAQRGELGAIENRLEKTVNNLSNIVTNTAQSRSRIKDTDYAVETTNLAKAQIIQQAATAMLAQANQQPQSVLALLQ